MEIANNEVTNLGKRGNPAWQKGCKSPNPSGRPKRIENLTEACRDLTPDALGVITEIMMDPESRGADRIAAAKVVIEYGYGKAIAAVAVNVAAQVDQMTEVEIMARIRELHAELLLNEPADKGESKNGG